MIKEFIWLWECPDFFEWAETDVKKGLMARSTRQRGVPFCPGFNKTDKFLKFALYIDDILSEIKAPGRHDTR